MRQLRAGRRDSEKVHLLISGISLRILLIVRRPLKLSAERNGERYNEATKRRRDRWRGLENRATLQSSGAV